MYNKMWKKVWCTALSGILLAGTLAGCAGQPAQPAADTLSDSEVPAESMQAPQTESAKPDGEKMTITINTQSSPGADEAWNAVADAYMEKNPNVKVTVDLKPTENYGDWLQNVFTQSDPTADIVNINLAGDTKNGKSINFMEYVENDSPYSDGKWSEQFNFQMQVRDLAKGEWDALSLDSVQVVWLYNKDIFEAAGVEPPKTWDEFVEVCEKLAAAGYQPISVPGDYNSFWAGKMGWLAQIYADQTTRSLINVFRAQEGDYCYDPDVDGIWKYDPADPYNDDPWKVNSNPVRAFASIKDGTFAPDSPGMKTVWTNFAQIFPKYAGGDAFFGTKDGIPLFYQGKAAITLDGAWRLINYKTDMAKLAAGEKVSDGADGEISGVQEFDIGTFNMPSMEGEGIEAPARTVEVANGFLGGISKEKAHDDQVVDFLMFFSSKEGQSIYLDAGLEAELVPSGPSLVYGVELPEEYQKMFDSLTFIGNCQKGHGAKLGRGMSGTNGDIQESYRQFYSYSYDYLSGKITVDDWLAKHKENIDQYFEEAITTSGMSDNDLKNPQNEPTGQ